MWQAGGMTGSDGSGPLRLTRRAVLVGLVPVASPALAQVDDSVPFVPTPPEIVEAMLDLAALHAGERLVDLGSGDGRIVLAAARRGAEALGVELSAALVARARARAKREGLEERARFSRGDLFAAPIRDADVVTLYLLPDVNLKLRPKLLAELRPGARIVSHSFHMGDWRPDGQRTADGKTLFLWVVPAVAGGEWRMALADGRVLPLIVEQRFQHVSGTLGGRVITDAVLSGGSLSFRWDGQAFHGLIGERLILPDPAASVGVATGWRAERPA